MAATSFEYGADGGVEQYREFIVDGDIYPVLDLSRRLLQREETDHRQRGEVALLLLDRLRSNGNDSDDHVNALLRVLANHATPTKDLTEELLSLLFFSDHRVQIIHHLPKLTYQSRECVHLVLNAYIDLLASDRLLLVPILGSLAELPLQAADKTIVVDATENLLDAVSEEDVPAVVQSLLSMLVPASAQRIARKIRSQCNRLATTTTLALTFDVILRHAVSGSGALQAFLRVIRHSETLTVFDVVLLTQLLARPSENQVAVRATVNIAVKGKLHSVVVRETMQRLRDQQWTEAYPSFVRLASALLAACLSAFRSPSVYTTIQAAVDMLGFLVMQRAAAQEEALSLLLSIVSQPQRLVLSLANPLYTTVAQDLYWDIAKRVAQQLVLIARHEPTALSPYAHTFLDHLYAIASAASHNTVGAAYPTPVLESLCRTLVVLVKHEPGMVSLVMITIQKQLIIPVGGLATAASSKQQPAAAALQVKQLMAVFLADEMLRQRVGEPTDRISLLAWMHQLLSSSTTSEATTQYVTRLLSNNDVTDTQSVADRAATATLLAAVCKRHGAAFRDFSESSTSEIPSETVPGLSSQKTGWLETSVVFDAAQCVRAMRFEALAPEEPAPAQRLPVDPTASSRLQEKISLLEVLFESYLATLATQGAQLERVLVCSFVLPVVTDESLNEKSLPSALWSYVVALQLAVLTANALATKHHSPATRVTSRSLGDVTRQRKRLLQRVETCWLFHQRLQTLLATATRSVESSSNNRRLLLQVKAIESRTSGLATLGSRLSLGVVSAVFEGLWKQQTTTIESGLEIELFRAFPAQVQAISASRQWLPRADQIRSSISLAALAEIPDGKRTLKYVSRRLLDYAEQLAALDHSEDAEGEDAEDEATEERAAAREWIYTGVKVLCEAVNAVIASCRYRRSQRELRVATTSDDDDGANHWEESVIELLAKGAVDERMRRPAPSAAWQTHCEIVYRSLVRAARRTQDRGVVCYLLELLTTLVERTRRQQPLSELCLALLHCPFPSTSVSSKLKTKSSTPPLLPLASSPHTQAVTALLRPSPVHHHHLVYFLVGTWVASPTTRVALAHIAYVVDAMAALVAAASSSIDTAVPGTSRKRKVSRQQEAGADSAPIEDDETLLQTWIARDGEHRLLKNLTNESLPVFLDAALTCLAASPQRAGTRQTSSSPFGDLVACIALLQRCLTVFVSAEATGFNLPIRTCAAVLRVGPVVAKAVTQSMLACLGRREARSMDQVDTLLAALTALVHTMDQAAQSFQEKLAVKMQTPSVRRVEAEEMEEDENGDPKPAPKKKPGRPKRGWSSALLSYAHGKRFQRRRALSQSEAALLPYYTHAIEQLRATVAEQRGIYRVELEDGDQEQAVASAFAALRLDGDVMERIMTLAMVGDVHEDEEEEHIAALIGERSAEELIELWRPVGEGQEEDEDEDEEFEEEDPESEEEADGRQGVSDEEAEDDEEPERAPISRKVLRTAAVNTLVPQKKRRRRQQS